jgi:hypothetical protein
MSPHHRASAETLQHQLVAMPPAVSLATVKRYCCGICSNGFDKKGNLTRHESTHAEHATPEAIAKRLKEKEYLRTYRRERREKDPIYRAREIHISRKNRANKKLRVGTAVPGDVYSEVDIDQVADFEIDTEESGSDDDAEGVAQGRAADANIDVQGAQAAAAAATAALADAQAATANITVPANISRIRSFENGVWVSEGRGGRVDQGRVYCFEQGRLVGSIPFDIEESGLYDDAEESDFEENFEVAAPSAKRKSVEKSINKQDQDSDKRSMKECLVVKALFAFSAVVEMGLADGDESDIDE